MTDSPTGGNNAGAPPASASGGTSAPPADGTAAAPQPAGAPSSPREEMIPRPRFDEVNQDNERLRQENERLAAQARTAQQQPTGQPARWEQLPDETVRAVLANPIKYADHHAAALAEWERRLTSRVTSQASQAVSAQAVKDANPDAFDATKPLGREVARLLDPNRPQGDVLRDVIDFAKFKLGQPSRPGTPNQALAANLTNALETPPGGTGAPPGAPPIDWLNLPEAEFRQRQSDILMGPRA